MELEDLEDETPNVELKIEEPNEDVNEDPESAEANISSGTITLDKPSTPSIIDISQESPLDQPIKGKHFIMISIRNAEYLEKSASPVPETSSTERTNTPPAEDIQIEKSDQPQIVENGADGKSGMNSTLDFSSLNLKKGTVILTNTLIL